MDVKMKHGLPRTRTYIEHSAVSLLDIPLARNFGRREVAEPDQFRVVSLGLFQSGKMFLGDDEHMRGRLRIDVFEGEHMLVLINFFRGNLAA
jgi:hypothetical protein